MVDHSAGHRPGLAAHDALTPQSPAGADLVDTPSLAEIHARLQAAGLTTADTDEPASVPSRWRGLVVIAFLSLLAFLLTYATAAWAFRQIGG